MSANVLTWSAFNHLPLRVLGNDKCLDPATVGMGDNEGVWIRPFSDGAPVAD